MSFTKKSLYIFGVVLFASTQLALAFSPKETARYFNGPTITDIGSTGATLSLSSQVLADMTPEEKSGVYFEYNETNKVCIAIYPTPADCLPKKTAAGLTEVKVTDLKPNTSYTVTYKRDNTIRCITTPCPGNEFQSMSVEFITKSDASTSVGIKLDYNFGHKSSGDNVITLQNFLIQKGYLKASATGYFGVKTLQAVKDFQKANNISPTGFVGPVTRAALLGTVNSYTEEKFEGTISAFSTACFADADCTVTVAGKKILLTRGWVQGPVGVLKGVESIGDLEKKIGAKAKVYAAKSGSDYTLYGDTKYYVEVQ